MKTILKTILIGLAGIICLASSLYLNSGEDTLNDGPYIFSSGKNFRAKWIEKGKLRQQGLNAGNFTEFSKKFNLLFEFGDLAWPFSAKPEFRQNYSGVDSIVILSDIHGRYDFYIDIMKAHNVIDENLRWKFGSGRLVIVGDVFDRGDKVTDVLWHIYGLERQAEKAGGKVHLLLGNHELLLFSRNISYYNPKYAKVEELTYTDYHDLYNAKSVLGTWLRIKPVAMSMNDILFVHGGISIQTVRRNLDIEQINRKYYDQIMNMEVKTASDIEERKFLNGELGPVWYRGYFNDAIFCEFKMDSILGHFNAKHIVVGHTQCEEIASLFGDKVLGIDTSVEDEHPGEILLYKEGVFYRCLHSGERIRIGAGKDIPK